MHITPLFVKTSATSITNISKFYARCYIIMCTSTISLQWWHTMFLPYPSTPYLISFPYSLPFLNLFTNFFKFTFDAQFHIQLFFFSIFRNLLKFLSSFSITFPFRFRYHYFPISVLQFFSLLSVYQILDFKIFPFTF
jgi:hypothetical protein